MINIIKLLKVDICLAILLSISIAIFVNGVLTKMQTTITNIPEAQYKIMDKVYIPSDTLCIVLDVHTNLNLDPNDESITKTTYTLISVDGEEYGYKFPEGLLSPYKE